MFCPNCKEKDCQEFFNEPMEVRQTHFTPVSVILACIGFLMFIVAGAMFLSTNLSDSMMSMIRGIISLIGFFIFVFALLIGAHTHYKQIYRIKVLCKKCGYQYMLTQANIREMPFQHSKKLSSAGESPNSNAVKNNINSNIENDK